MNTPIELTPPQDTHAEAAVIESMLLAYSCIRTVRGIIRASSEFVDYRHAALYEAITSVFDQTGDSEWPLVLAELKRRGAWEHIGTAYMFKLINTVPGPSAHERYAHDVHKLALQRALISELDKKLKEAWEVVPTVWMKAAEAVPVKQTAKMERPKPYNSMKFNVAIQVREEVRHVG